MKTKKMLQRVFLTGILFIGSQVCAQNSSSLNLDGVDDRVSFDYPGIAGNGARTVEAWIKVPTSVTTTSSHQTITSWGPSSNGERFTFSVAGTKLRAEIQGSGFGGTTAINDGQWHHVAVVFVPAGNKVHVYLDGNFELSAVFSVTVNTTATDSVYVGTRLHAGNHINRFTGDIDEFRIWSTSKTQLEIQANMNQEICNPPADLVLYPQFNEGVAGANNTSISSIADVTSNAYTGYLRNFALTGATTNFSAGGPQNGPSASTVTEVVCGDYTWPVNGTIYTTGGTYKDTLVNAIGCDSIITLDLTINPVDISTTTSSNTITASSTTATYQWLDCDNGNAIITGETNQVFTVTANGSYAVEITEGSCVDTSACVNITTVGVLENSLEEQFAVYPNPNSGNISIALGKIKTNLKVTLRNSLGQVILTKKYNSTDLINLDINTPKGIYFLQLETNGEVITKRIVKE